MGTTLRPRAEAPEGAGRLPAHPRPLGGSPLRSTLRKLDERLSPYVLVAPFFLLFLAFGLFPLAYTLVVSLYDWDLIGGAEEWVGLGNYRDLLTDEYFWNALRNTLSIFVISTVPQLLLALVIAHLLNQRLRGRTFFRMAVVLPMVTSVAAVTIIFNQLYARDFGLVNHILGFFGVEPIEWQAHVWSSHLALATIVDWRWTGWNALIYLAAMQAIPKELYEAARIDGASTRQQFWRITVPMLRPAIVFTVIMATIGGMQLFAEPLLFQDQPGSVSGGADRQFQTVVLYLYERGFRRFDLGDAATIAWTLFVLIAIFSLINFLITRRIRSAED